MLELKANSDPPVCEQCLGLKKMFHLGDIIVKY